MNGKVFLITGLSGSGKTSFSNIISKELKIPILVSTTTRPKREKEIEGKDYFFVKKEEFLSHKMLEFTTYNENFYGIEQEYFEKSLKENPFSILIVDLSGIIRYNKLYPNKFINILIDIEREKSFKYLSQRDGEEQARKRYKNDLQYNFEDHKKLFDLIIYNNKSFNKVKHDFLKKIKNITTKED